MPQFEQGLLLLLALANLARDVCWRTSMFLCLHHCWFHHGMGNVLVLFEFKISFGTSSQRVFDVLISDYYYFGLRFISRLGLIRD